MTLQKTTKVLIFLTAGALTACGDKSVEAEGSSLDLYINEFLAANDSIIANVNGDYVDWVELYNESEVDLSLDGFYMTDDLDEPLFHPLSAELTVPAGGYLLLWADKESDLGDYHLPFALEKSGEQLGLSYIDDGGEPVLLDGVAFGAQETDISWGRLPDAGEWSAVTPTPGTEN
ncbi:MAG: hypothetical protein ACI8RZ_000456 [Myxococcota bacterium]|jgi:hypothetical protein